MGRGSGGELGDWDGMKNNYQFILTPNESPRKNSKNEI